ncbi:MAG: hypothetical protein KAZ37_00730 [Rhodocyclaceae bacterium]|uniref:hypothetical protein n=1 Tax=Fluviibacter phosphoraccumulans TaxID=1751046 RepID=UPI0010B29B5F|nr:hypothetical protein [Fluviibacter phosphoraccumulans]MBP7917756.1 hypothetical protein [Rhodocyclaceae bacterium]
MQKALQKTLLKLGVAGCLALIVFNYPLLSLYRGYVGGLPTLYVVLFGLWLGLILIARRVADPSAMGSFKRKSNQDFE